jgi:hypothetical protein
MTSDEDVIVWALNKGGVYSTKSLYKFVSSGGVVSRRMLGGKNPPEGKNLPVSGFQ